MKNSLNPGDRKYQVGDTDQVFVKSESPRILDVLVVEIDGVKPVFKVISPGEYLNKVLHIWDIVFL